jgi:hypothetical protein
MENIIAAIVGIAVYLVSVGFLIPQLTHMGASLMQLAFCWPPLLVVGLLAAGEVHRRLSSRRDRLINRFTLFLIAIAASVGFITAILVSVPPPG